MDSTQSGAVPEVTIPRLPATFGSGGADDPILLDVREVDEWQRGHAPDALHVPMADALQQLAETGELAGIAKTADLYVVCHAGGRSMRVARSLVDKGYSPRNVTGGMASWAAAGRTVVTDDGSAGSV